MYLYVAITSQMSGFIENARHTLSDIISNGYNIGYIEARFSGCAACMLVLASRVLRTPLEQM